MNRKRAALVLLAVAVTVLFLGLFARTVIGGWAAMRQAFAQGQWFWLAPATAMLLLVFVLKGFRWQLIMKPIARPGYWPLFSATAIGFMVNCVLLLRVGEVVRAVVLGLKQRSSHGGLAPPGRVSMSGAFATIVVERLFDILGIVGAGFIGLAWLAWRRGQAAQTGRVQLLALFFAVAAILGTGALGLLRFRPGWARSLAAFLVRWLPAGLRRRGEGLVNSFIGGLTVIRDLPQGLAVLALSVVHWLMMGTMAYFTSLCFLAQTFSSHGSVRRFDLGLGGALLVQGFQSFMVSLPAAPGFLGTHQAATAEASKIILGPEAGGIAGAYAIVLWCVSILPVIALGFVCLWVEGLSLGEVRRLARQGDGGPAAGSPACLPAGKAGATAPKRAGGEGQGSAEGNSASKAATEG